MTAELAPLTVLKGVGPGVAARLSALHLHTLQDLLFHLPLRYQDRTRISPIAASRIGSELLLEGQVLGCEITFGRRRSLLCRIKDATGIITLRFYHFSAAQKNALTPGVLVRQRCQFEGCRGIENAHIALKNVQVPIEHVIGDIGKGLKYALTILNVGRGISIPAICLGMAKQAWQPTLDRANSRVTFQKPLAERQTQQIRIGDMAGHLFAMEALALLVWRLADQHRYDIRIEAAVAKIFCSEHTIRFIRDAQTIFGGMGYETADSKHARGEAAFGIEQLVRDAEMYRIGEGATDILRPFVVREGLSPHLDRAKRF